MKQMNSFGDLCAVIKKKIDELEESENKPDEVLKRQSRAILGLENEVNYYRNLIRKILSDSGFSCELPAWYDSLEEGVFQENLGFSCLSEWIKGTREELKSSSSAKVIGDRVYFQIGGELVLQPQTLPYERRMQLRRALLLTAPQNRNSDPYHEVYLEDGSRVTIFSEGISKRGQDTIVFRKFFVKNYTFEKQAELHTIPREAIDLFKSMVRVGYNDAFVGAVKTAKTTFLATWQSYEDQQLEGVQLETDPELPWHLIMPKAPILQLVPDGIESLKKIIKPVMRADGDYIIMAEARDGYSLGIAVKAANKGTRRVKMTFHTTDSIDFCYDVADEIVLAQGGNLYSRMIKVAKSFHFIFHFVQLADKSKKRLKAIWEIRYNDSLGDISMVKICEYDYVKDSWVWSGCIGEDKRIIGAEESPEALERMEKELSELARNYPMQGDPVNHPYYAHLKGVAL